MNKKDKLNSAKSKLKERGEGVLLDSEERAELGKSFKSPTSKYKRALFVVELSQIEDLNNKVERVNQYSKNGINKSQLVRLGIDLINEMNEQELLKKIAGI